MKPAGTARSLDKTLLAIIGVLLILIGGVFFIRSLSTPTNPELYPDQRINGTPAADGFMTVFMLADNAALAFQTYQTNLLFRALLPLIFGVIGVLYAVAVLFYASVFSLRPKQTMYSIGTISGILAFLGLGGLTLVSRVDAEHVTNCSQLQSVYDSREYKIAEGIVTVTYQSKGHGHGESGDIIQVGTAPLEITNYEPTCAYDKIIIQGGTLTEGTYARVYYTVERKILRIDVKNP